MLFFRSIENVSRFTSDQGDPRLQGDPESCPQVTDTTTGK